MEKYSIIAPLGDNFDAIYLGIREFPTEKIYLIHTGGNLSKAEELKKELEKFRIGLHPVEIRGNLLEGMFRAFAQIKRETSDDRLLVNVSSGDKMGMSASLAAAFVNGLKAFHVEGDRVSMFPVLKFSYYRLLPERKLAILGFLKDQPDCCSSLEELSQRTGMSLPLMSYHINGNAKAEGLITQGLVQAHVGPRGKTQVMLTELGRLIAEGIVERPAEKVEARN
ncbi:MAG: hypothetical protein HYY68_03330 [Thaumarchaeota archaeon]|nr:hypothetical protein [Nitrososphaerota archaeon]